MYCNFGLYIVLLQSMDQKTISISELQKKKRADNIKARRLIAQFLGLDVRECNIPLNKCSSVLKRFASDYNKLVIEVKDKEKDRQGSLF